MTYHPSPPALSSFDDPRTFLAQAVENSYIQVRRVVLPTNRGTTREESYLTSDIHFAQVQGMRFCGDIGRAESQQRQTSIALHASSTHACTYNVGQSIIDGLPTTNPIACRPEKGRALGNLLPSWIPHAISGRRHGSHSSRMKHAGRWLAGWLAGRMPTRPP